jgi:hypothetical protein
MPVAGNKFTKSSSLTAEHLWVSSETIGLSPIQNSCHKPQLMNSMSSSNHPLAIANTAN